MKILCKIPALTVKKTFKIFSHEFTMNLCLTQIVDVDGIMYVTWPVFIIYIFVTCA